MKRFSILLLILCTCLTAAAAWAGSRIVYVPPPTGTDDTANIQAALDACVEYGKNCTVQLTAGTYLTRQLVEYNFQGTFKGMGKDITVIQALPYLPVTVDFLQPCQPNTTTCFWPTLMIFVDGNISISDLSVHMIATDGTATAPWAGGATYIETGIRLMGQYSTTNVLIDRFEMEGRPDDTSPYGFNVTNGIMYTGELTASSANPLDLPCGAPGGFYFASGSYTVRNSSFKLMVDGVSQDGCVRSSHVVIGGSPATGNSFENLTVGMDLESAENSDFEISYNVVSGIGNSMWVIPWIESVFLPSKPSRYVIHDNKFITTGTSSFLGDLAGVVLSSDTPDDSWIDAVIWNNTIQLQQALSDGIDAFGTKGTIIFNNSIAGTGFDAVGLYGSTYSTVIGNNLSKFVPDPSQGIAQIYLDPGTIRDLVVCGESTDTVLNQGTNNVLVGCQQAASTPAAETRSEAVGSSVSPPRFPRGKRSPYKP
jgi:hypothetical protein